MAQYRPWVIGNWKMNLSLAEGRALLSALEAWEAKNPTTRLSIAVPSVFAPELATLSNHVDVLLQNIHWAPKGAFTGEVSAPMVRQLCIQGSLVGHSERREMQGESNTVTGHKVRALRQSGLTSVLCVGETYGERVGNTWREKLRKQVMEAFKAASLGLEDLLGSDPTSPKWALAYEPIWAIGTGLAATPEQANGTHAFLYEVLESLFPKNAHRIPILYGGSVTPQNAQALLSQPSISGALVGGASLSAESFLAIASQAHTPQL